MPTTMITDVQSQKLKEVKKHIETVGVIFGCIKRQIIYALKLLRYFYYQLALLHAIQYQKEIRVWMSLNQ